MLRLGKLLCVIAMTLWLAGCEHVPSFQEAVANANLPPVPPTMARIYFYRPLSATMGRIYFYRALEPYESLEFAQVSLNGTPVGYSQNGAVFYRDVPPGTYRITVFSRGRYPYEPPTVTVVPGETIYADIESATNWDPHFPDETFAVVIPDPSIGWQEIQPLWLIHG